MSKSKYYFGQNIVGQVLKLISSSIVSKATKETGSVSQLKNSVHKTIYIRCVIQF